MSTLEQEFSFDKEVARKALDRWQKTAIERESKLDAAKRQGVAGAESADRLVKRANRLLNMVKKAAPATPVGTKSLGELLDRGATREEVVQPQFLERVIGETKDFLRIEFLEKALFAKERQWKNHSR